MHFQPPQSPHSFSQSPPPGMQGEQEGPRDGEGVSLSKLGSRMSCNGLSSIPQELCGFPPVCVRVCVGTPPVPCRVELEFLLDVLLCRTGLGMSISRKPQSHPQIRKPQFLKHNIQSNSAGPPGHLPSAPPPCPKPAPLDSHSSLPLSASVPLLILFSLLPSPLPCLVNAHLTSKAQLKCYLFSDAYWLCLH